MKRTANVSHCGQYRYSLTREWDDTRARVLFIMLNPSTADASVDDPTIRRCIGFACSWGFGSLEVVNLSPIRSADPAALLRRDVPGDRWAYRTNALEIEHAGERAALIIQAWGANKAVGKLGLGWRMFEQRQHLYAIVRRLGSTKDLSPKHPLYVPSAAVPVDVWR